MLRGYGLIIILLFSALATFAQGERKVIRQGVKAYNEEDYREAEVAFRKASDMNKESFEAGYNTGAALYAQKKYKETVKEYQPLLGQGGDPVTESHLWHNIGNSLLQEKAYEQSIDAYKNSLRLNPGDQDTKYNLAYALEKLKEQQQQQKQQQQQQNKDQKNQQKKQDQKQQQDQQDQQKKQDQQQQQEDQQKKEEQKQQQNKDQQKKQDQQQQPQPQKISREDAERMLNAIQQQEKDVKAKVDEKKAAAAKVKTDKDW